MNEDFVSFSLAKKLKEKGFREPCMNAINLFGCTYRNGWCEYLDDRSGEFITQCDLKDGDYLLPTISQVLKWLRERNIILAINPSYFKEDCCFGWDCDIWVNANYNHRCVSDNSYEAAALAGIEYCLDNLI